MLKYSTYRSIYDEAPVVESIGHNSVNRSMLQLKEMFERLVGAGMGLFRQDLLIKMALVIVLVISGFTVVGNVFAGSTSIVKEEKRVVVERGDTLWGLALKNKPADMKTVVYIEGIIRASGLEDANIKAGDVLTLPIY